MNRGLLLASLLLFQVLAQAPAETKVSVSGTVIDSVAGRPLAGYNVSTYLNVRWLNDTVIQSPSTKQVTSVTDEQGRYQLSDLPPGLYRIRAQNAESINLSMTRQVLVAGRDLDHVDFKMELEGSIVGRVVDENREPVPKIGVRLVSREYYSGTLGYYVKRVVDTDDRGVYRFQHVPAGHPYLLMAEKTVNRFSAPRSEAPLDPKLRRRVPKPTFYPNSPDPQGGSLITLRPGETREGADIEIKKSPAFCIDGVVASLGGPGALNFGFDAVQPAFSTSSTGGLAGFLQGVSTGPDGKFRVCDLSPGSYRFGASDTDGPNANRGLLVVDVVDRDLHNVNLTVSPPLSLDGEVIWDGAAPETPITDPVRLSLRPLMRTSIGSEGPGGRAGIPGTFSLTGLVLSDYVTRALVTAPGLYIKDVTYNGQSVLYAPLRFGSAIGNAGLRVVVARDGATLSVRVQDKDGNPQADTRVLIAPAAILSEAMLHAAMVVGQTDQTGQYKSSALRPGKYLVLATADKVDPTPESIDNFWRSRNRFQEVELPPSGSAEVKLTPVSLQ